MGSFSSDEAQPLICSFWIGGIRPKTETILKDLQKHFRGNWLANMQNLILVTQMPTVHGMPRGGGLVDQRGGWVVDYRSHNSNKLKCLQSPSSQGQVAKVVRCVLVTLSCVKFEVTMGV